MNVCMIGRVITVPKLELHLADACNLRCTGCTHYADHGLSGVLPLEEGGRWLEHWSTRIRPVHLSLLGGEPLLNRDLLSFLQIVRQLFPTTRRRLVTNGLLLLRWERLWPVLADTATILTISEHSRAEPYQQRFRPALERARHEAASRGFALEVRDCTTGWYRLHEGDGPDIAPYADGDPVASWSSCASRHCLTLRDDALWKCPPIAHLPAVAAWRNLDTDPAWRPYLDYRPLTLDASDDALRRFVGRGPEPCCGMCPARRVPAPKQVRVADPVVRGRR